jgi:hypothetical protein
MNPFSARIATVGLLAAALGGCAYERAYAPPARPGQTIVYRPGAPAEPVYAGLPAATGYTPPPGSYVSPSEAAPGPQAAAAPPSAAPEEEALAGPAGAPAPAEAPLPPAPSFASDPETSASPAEAWAAAVEEPREVASIDVFYDALAPYGTWVEVEPYGYCWRPFAAVVGADWQPYTCGRWVYTDWGWTWVSFYAWGWAPFHYGRWWCHPSYGWLWVPDVTWGPAWVTWRACDEYIGWAPLPPRYAWDVVRPCEPALGFEAFVFVRSGLFLGARLDLCRVPAVERPRVFSRCRPIYDLRPAGGIVVNIGPSAAFVSATTRIAVAPVRVRDVVHAGAREGTAVNFRARVHADAVEMYRPRFREPAGTGLRRLPGRERAPRAARAEGFVVRPAAPQAGAFAAGNEQPAPRLEERRRSAPPASPAGAPPGAGGPRRAYEPPPSAPPAPRAWQPAEAPRPAPPVRRLEPGPEPRRDAPPTSPSGPRPEAHRAMFPPPPREAQEAARPTRQPPAPRAEPPARRLEPRPAPRFDPPAPRSQESPRTGRPTPRFHGPRREAPAARTDPRPAAPRAERPPSPGAGAPRSKDRDRANER